MMLVRPCVIPEVSVTPAHRYFGNDDTESAFITSRHQCIYPAIGLTINEIVQIATPAFVPALIQNAAAIEMFREEIAELTVRRFSKFPLLDVRADHNV